MIELVRVQAYLLYVCIYTFAFAEPGGVTCSSRMYRYLVCTGVRCERVYSFHSGRVLCVLLIVSYNL